MTLENIKILLTLCLTLVGASIAAQSGFQYGAGARSIGIGQITTVLDDPSAGFGNAAALSFNSTQGILLTGGQRFGESELKEIGITASFQSGKQGAFFGSVQYFGFDLYNEQKIGIGYTRALSSTTAASLQFNLYQFRIEEYGNTIQPGFELGFYTQVTKEFTLGAHLVNPVRIESEDGIAAPTVIRVGSAYRPSEKVTVYGEVEKDIDFPANFKIGIEYYPMPAFALRLGATTEPSSIHFGAGYLIRDQLRIDIGVGYDTLLGVSPSVGILFTPNSSQE